MIDIILLISVITLITILIGMFIHISWLITKSDWIYRYIVFGIVVSFLILSEFAFVIAIISEFIERK